MAVKRGLRTATASAVSFALWIVWCSFPVICYSQLLVIHPEDVSPTNEVSEAIDADVTDHRRSLSEEDNPYIIQNAKQNESQDDDNDTEKQPPENIRKLARNLHRTYNHKQQYTQDRPAQSPPRSVPKKRRLATAAPTTSPTTAKTRVRFYTQDTLHKTYRYGNSYQYRGQPSTAHYDRSNIPVSLTNPASIANDPLRNPNFNVPRQPVDWEIDLPYLGVLIDGGRHYFPMGWLKRVVDYIADMKYNLIHLRLTDDQAFNVLLESRPQLAYPSILENPYRRVWTPTELRELVQYAKDRGVAIMPELNMPGHAGAWAGIPHIVTRCPTFTCEKGYGIPLNLTHPELRSILRDVLNETMHIFDPPFLHLGGDEVNMAQPCFDETNTPLYDFAAFEVMLQGILDEIGIPVESVVRWEMTGQWARVTPSYCGAGAKCDPSNPHIRAGAIEQMWESYPYERHSPTPRFFLSNQLYFDTNGDQGAMDVYARAQKAFQLRNGAIPTALIVGTFELSTQFWYDRNILGRLLAVSMGVAKKPVPPTSAPTESPTLVPSSASPSSAPVAPTQTPVQSNATLLTPQAIKSRVLMETTEVVKTNEMVEEAEDGTDGAETEPTISPSTLTPTASPSTFSPTVLPSTLTPTTSPTTISPTGSPTLPPPIYRYAYYCKLVGISVEMCEREGRPMIPTSQYQISWQNGWKAWKTAICERMTYGKNITVFKAMEMLEAEARAKTTFFESFGMDRDTSVIGESLPQISRGDLYPVKHVGVILDTTSSLVRLDRLQTLVKLFAKFDFDIIQLRVAGSKGFTMKSGKQPNLPYSMLYNPDRAVEALRHFELRRFVEEAKILGMEIIPEISFTSNAAGWYGGGFLAECPHALCNGELVAHDLRKAGLFPVIFSVLEEIGEIFRSKFLHLGHDNRQASQACFGEAGIDMNIFDRFEHKLGALLEFAEIPETNVLRYENVDPAQNDVVYRAGAIRHYPSETHASDIQSDDPFFVTVNILDGSLLEVYVHTRKLMDLKPMGIVAELRYLSDSEWENYQIVQRLIAFALGTIQGDGNQHLLLEDEAAFTLAYIRFCQLLRVSHLDCTVLPDALEFPLEHITDSEAWTNAECELRTEVKELCLSKTILPFFSDTAVQGLQVSNDSVLYYAAATTQEETW